MNGIIGILSHNCCRLDIFLRLSEADGRYNGNSTYAIHPQLNRYNFRLPYFTGYGPGCFDRCLNTLSIKPAKNTWSAYISILSG